LKTGDEVFRQVANQALPRVVQNSGRIQVERVEGPLALNPIEEEFGNTNNAAQDGSRRSRC